MDGIWDLDMILSYDLFIYSLISHSWKDLCPIFSKRLALSSAMKMHLVSLLFSLKTGQIFSTYLKVISKFFFINE